MVKFKVGDRVKVVSLRWDSTRRTQSGLTGTIIQADDPTPSINNLNITVQFDGPDQKGYHSNGYHSTDLELLEPAPPNLRDYNDYYLAITGDTDGQNP